MRPTAHPFYKIQSPSHALLLPSFILAIFSWNPFVFLFSSSLYGIPPTLMFRLCDRSFPHKRAGTVGSFPMRLGANGIAAFEFSNDVVESIFSAKECFLFSDLHCEKPNAAEVETPASSFMAIHKQTLRQLHNQTPPACSSQCLLFIHPLCAKIHVRPPQFSYFILIWAHSSKPLIPTCSMWYGSLIFPQIQTCVDWFLVFLIFFSFLGAFCIGF